MQSRLAIISFHEIHLTYCNERSLSAIVICRHHLDLQRENRNPNAKTTWNLPTLSIGSFKVAIPTMHDVIVAEFGDSSTDEVHETDATRDEIIPLNMAKVMAGDDISLVEIRCQLPDA